MFLMVSTLFLTGCNVSVSKDEEVEFVETSQEEQSETSEAVKVFLNKIDQNNYETWDELSSVLKKTASLEKIDCRRVVIIAQGDQCHFVSRFF